MRGPGILWMLQTAAGLSMAGPMFVVGIEFLRSGQYVFGSTFLAFGAIALYLPTYFVNRIGGPRTWLRRRIGRSTETDTARGGEHTAEEGDSTSATGRPNPDAADTEDATDSASGSGRVPVLDRFRDR